MAQDPELKYAQDFASLAAELHQESTELPTLELIVQRAVETVDGCDCCGVSVRDAAGLISTPASTAPIVDAADRLQYELNEGPCVEAIWTLDTYLIDDLRAEPRWPQWAPQAADLGIGSTLSVRIETPVRQSRAALNLYAKRPGSFDHTDVAIASILARHAGIALADARNQEQLRTALRSRQTIGVAQGILMQRFGLDLDQAFEVLHRYSQDNNIKLRTLAENLVRSGGLPDDAGSGTDLNRTLATAFGLPSQGEPVGTDRGEPAGES